MQPFDKVMAAAEGYLQLGLLEDALEELQRLTPSERLQPDSLLIESAILMRARRWVEALERNEELIRRSPRAYQGYLHASFCLHELGRTTEARDRLLSAPLFVTEQALFYYNLACYEAQLENPDEAASLLRIAFRRDAALCQVALQDPDLEPVQEVVKALVQSIRRPAKRELGDAGEEDGEEDGDDS
jgi:tetratricopeptide (TPR) repeat protein